MRRARIVCTLGPATSSRESIERLARAGMDVARLNFSHGTFEEHLHRLALIREVGATSGKPIAALFDLPGPKIRIGAVRGNNAVLETNKLVTIVVSNEEGTAERLTTPYLHLTEEIKPGHRILLDDGKIELKAVEVSRDVVTCHVVKGGNLSSKKGMNFPGAGKNLPALTERDRQVVEFGCKQGMDYVALSFVRRAKDLLELRESLDQNQCDARIIAKLEKPEAIDDLERILEVSDAVMVARGDLGIEMSPAEVPVLQKRILRKARSAWMPAIVATQMLESMTRSPRPTRAEASDVANAVFDGADALMLSEETAVGQYPQETVEMMSEIIKVAEAEMVQTARFSNSHAEATSVAHATCLAACQAANQLKAKWLVGFTESGTTARLLSQSRPAAPIIAFTPHEAIARRLKLYWGITPMLLPQMKNTDEMIASVDRHLSQNQLATAGDLLVIVCGSPVGQRGLTNLFKLHRVGSDD